MNEILERYATEDFRAYFIVWEDASYNPANATYCASQQTRFGLTAPTVLFAEGRLATIGIDDRHFHFVMRRGSEIVYRRQFDDTGFEAIIQQILAE